MTAGTNTTIRLRCLLTGKTLKSRDRARKEKGAARRLYSHQRSYDMGRSFPSYPSFSMATPAAARCLSRLIVGIAAEALLIPAHSSLSDLMEQGPQLPPSRRERPPQYLLASVTGSTSGGASAALNHSSKTSL